MSILPDSWSSGRDVVSCQFSPGASVLKFFCAPSSQGYECGLQSPRASSHGLQGFPLCPSPRTRLSLAVLGTMGSGMFTGVIPGWTREVSKRSQHERRTRLSMCPPPLGLKAWASEAYRTDLPKLLKEALWMVVGGGVAPHCVRESAA